MSEPQDEDYQEYERLAKYDNSYSQEALRTYKQLFPEPRPPQTSNYPSESFSQYSQNQPVKKQKKEKSTTISYQECESRYKSWVQNLAKRTRKINPEFLKCGGMQSEKEKKIPVWESTKKKQPKAKKPNMPKIVYDPFSNQDSDDSQSRSLSRSKPRKRVHRDEEEKVFINPYYMECINQLRANGDLPLSKSERKKQKKERKECLQMLESMNVEGQESQQQTTNQPLAQLSIIASKTKQFTKQEEPGEISYPSLTKVEEKDGGEIQNSNNHPLLSVKEEEKSLSNYLIGQPQQSSPPTGSNQKVEKSNQNEEKFNQKEEKQPESENLLRIGEELKRVKKKLTLVQQQLSKCKDNEKIQKLLYKKRKYIKQTDALLEEEIQERSRSKYRRPPPKKVEQAKKETEWEKLRREQQEKKERDQRLIKEHRQAIAERKEMYALEFAPDISSTKNIEEFLNQRDQIRRKAQESLKSFYCTKKQYEDPQFHHHKQSQKKQKKEQYDKKLQSSKKIPPKKRVTSQDEEVDWRRELKKVTGYDPRSSKFQRRDRSQIHESGFDQIQMQEKVSKKLGRKEEEEDRAHDVQEYDSPFM